MDLLDLSLGTNPNCSRRLWHWLKSLSFGEGIWAKCFKDDRERHSGNAPFHARSMGTSSKNLQPQDAVQISTPNHQQVHNIQQHLRPTPSNSNLHHFSERMGTILHSKPSKQLNRQTHLSRVWNPPTPTSKAQQKHPTQEKVIRGALQQRNQKAEFKGEGSDTKKTIRGMKKSHRFSTPQLNLLGRKTAQFWVHQWRQKLNAMR